MARVPDSAATRGSFVRRNAVWLSIVVVLILAVGGYLWWRATSQKPKYVTAVVTRGTVQRSVSMTGALNPVITVQVGSYVSGTLKTLKCDYNTEVVVGQVCATIDPVPFQLIVDQDQAEVGTAEAQLKKDRAALTYAKIAYERDSKLLAEGTVSQDAVDNDKSVMDQTVAQIGLDQATIVNKEATLKAAQVNLAYTNIVSPVVGTVITRSIDVGQTVAASLQSPTLFLIGKDLTKMQVDTNVSEADVGAVLVGQDALFSVQAYPARTFHGKVVMIRHGPITVQNVVTYDVVVAVDNPDRALFPGMTADTHIVIDEHDNVLRVPLPAVRFTPEGLGGHGKGERGARQHADASASAAGPADSTGTPADGTASPASTSAATSASTAAGTEASPATAGAAATPATPAADGAPGERRHHRLRDGGGAGGPGADAAGAAGAAGADASGDAGAGQPGEGRHGRGRHGDGSGGWRGQRGGAGDGSGDGSGDGQGGEGRPHRWGGGRGGDRAAAGAGGAERAAGGATGAGAAGARAAGGRAAGAGPGAGRGRWGEGRRAGGAVRHSKVWVLNADGTLRSVDVVTGLDDGTLIEVSSKDLKPGDRVVVNELHPNEERRPGAGGGLGGAGGGGRGQGQGGQGFGPGGQGQGPGPRL